MDKVGNLFQSSSFLRPSQWSRPPLPIPTLRNSSHLPHHVRGNTLNSLKNRVGVQKGLPGFKSQLHHSVVCLGSNWFTYLEEGHLQFLLPSTTLSLQTDTCQHSAYWPKSSLVTRINIFPFPLEVRPRVGKGIPAQQQCQYSLSPFSRHPAVHRGWSTWQSVQSRSFMFPWPPAWFLDATSPTVTTPRLSRATCPNALLGWLPFWQAQAQSCSAPSSQPDKTQACVCSYS